MIEWSEQHQMIREVLRRFVEAEIVPNLEELEHGDMPRRGSPKVTGRADGLQKSGDIVYTMSPP